MRKKTTMINTGLSKQMHGSWFSMNNYSRYGSAPVTNSMEEKLLTLFNATKCANIGQSQATTLNSVN